MLPERKYLSINEFSSMTGISETTIRRLVKAGSLTSSQPGGARSRILIRADALENSPAPPSFPDNSTVLSDSKSENSAPKSKGPRPKWQQPLGFHANLHPKEN